jgi:hypothetical protein
VVVVVVGAGFVVVVVGACTHLKLAGVETRPALQS